MKTHTPGPWKLVKRDTTFDIVGADGVHVLKTSWHNSIRDPYPLKDEAMRNALLATAAPEMLAALKELLEIRSGRTVKAAREAIAKAEGRSDA